MLSRVQGTRRGVSGACPGEWLCRYVARGESSHRSLPVTGLRWDGAGWSQPITGVLKSRVQGRGYEDLTSQPAVKTPRGPEPWNVAPLGAGRGRMWILGAPRGASTIHAWTSAPGA